MQPYEINVTKKHWKNGSRWAQEMFTVETPKMAQLYHLYI